MKAVSALRGISSPLWPKRKRYTKIGAISGKQLIRLLSRAGWDKRRKSRHGFLLEKGARKVVIPNKKRSLTQSTLGAILKEAGLDRDSLRSLIEKHGL